MKTINEPFEDKDYDKLVKAKGELTWHDFILKLLSQIVKCPYCKDSFDIKVGVKLQNEN